MNKFFSFVAERARGKVADESATEGPVLDQDNVAQLGHSESVPEAITTKDGELDEGQGEEPVYGIIIHNDNETTFDYVIFILTYYFMLSSELAEHIADVTHKEGSSLALLRPYEEAKYLIKIAHMKAELDGYPLKFSLQEPE